MKSSGPINLAYVRLAAHDIDASATFCSEILGLQAVEGLEGDRLFRCDARYHTVALHSGSVSALGIEVAHDGDLDEIRARLRAHGFNARDAAVDDCKRRFVRRALMTFDTGGLPVDIVWAPAQSGRRFFGTRDAGLRGLHSVGLRSTDMERDITFWTKIVGGQIGDRVGDITYLYFGSVHHRVALYPSSRSGLLYVTFEVESLDCVMQSFYHLQERQVRILQGPGRETASGQAFVRFAGNDGQMFAYGCDMNAVEDLQRRPRQFELDRYALCGWGSECLDTPELMVCSDKP